MRPKKQYGQNFLINKNIIKEIVHKADLKDKIVFEIGPGRGALTSLLTQEAKHIYAFEVDKALSSYLDELEENNNNLTVIYKDVLKVEFNEFMKQNNLKDAYLIANIPYYITGPILNKIKDSKNIKEATLMVQKEVADRLTATSGNRTYGTLSVIFNFYYEIIKILNVRRNNFYPIPKVDSAVVKLTKRDKYLKMVKDESLFNEFVDASFKMKRKTLVNNLSSYYKLNKEEVINRLIEVEKDFNLLERAENITIERFIGFVNGWKK